MSTDPVPTPGPPLPDPALRSSPAPPAAGAEQEVGARPVGAQLLGRRFPALMAAMSSRVVRLGFLAVVLALLGFALYDEAGTLWGELQRLSAGVLLVAFASGLGGLICSLMVWRTILADLGSPLPLPAAWRIMFIGQLGKYLPGSIWPVLAQTELGADEGVPRSRSALSVLLSYSVMTCTGGIVAAVTLPFAAGSFERYFWVLFAVPVALVLLSPPVLNRLFGLLLRMLRRAPLQQGLSVRGLSRTMGWALAGWACNGLMTYVLLRRLAGPSNGAVLVSVGGYALSWVAGFVAVFAPAGAGVREAVMVAVLSTRTTAATALTVALVTRALAVVGDAVTGAGAAALIGRRRVQQLRAGASQQAQAAGDG
jgi:glycosyltransferase 2 family protein